MEAKITPIGIAVLVLLTIMGAAILSSVIAHVPAHHHIARAGDPI